MLSRVIIGTASVFLTLVLLGYVAVTEQDRMASFTQAYDARQVEVGAALYENNCISCHGNKGQGIEGVAPALNAPDLFNGTRLKEIGWTGTTDDYIRGAIASGRPRPSNAFATYPNRMPTWSQQYGGPMRPDQVDSLVSFIMNWGKAYEGLPIATPVPIDGVGTDITITLPEGNAENGKKLATDKGCTACHITAPVGPAWLATGGNPGVGARAETTVKDAAYTGKAKDAQGYLFESIVAPNAHVVTGFKPDIMTKTFGDTLTEQDTADLIAYMLTLK